MMYDLTEDDIECLGNLFTQAFVKAHPSPLPRESTLFQKIMKQREESIIKARAEGRLIG